MTFSAALKPIQYLMKSDGEWELELTSRTPCRTSSESSVIFTFKCF